ncbi:MAG: ABC transporter permease [Planctomycetota bacterium]|nr:MAG: ABC transporter permease [Planctomycetota bacterium]
MLAGALMTWELPWETALFAALGGLLVALLGGTALVLLVRGWAKGLVQKELRHFFYSPIAWLTMAGFALVNGFVFLFLVDLYTGTPGEPLVRVFFGTGFFWVLQLIVIPAITMRLLAEERSRGTLETLLTAPVRDAEVVFAKFAAALGFYMVLWLPTVLLLGVALHFAAPEGFWAELWALRARGLGWPAAAVARASEVMDLGPVATAYAGTFLMGAAWIAIGLLASALTRNQIVAFIGTFVTLLLLLSVGQLELLVPSDPMWFPGLREVLRAVSFSHAFAGFPSGVVDTRAVVWFLSVAAYALFLAVRALESHRWR